MKGIEREEDVEDEQEDCYEEGREDGEDEEADDDKVRWLKHYSSAMEVLLVGDGAFSFSLCLAAAFGKANNITATSLNTYGSPCVLAIFFFSPLVSYGVMAILFPLFVLTAADTRAELIIDSIRTSWGGGGPGKLPIFYAANKLSLSALRLFPEGRKS